MNVNQIWLELQKLGYKFMAAEITWILSRAPAQCSSSTQHTKNDRKE